MEIAYIMICSYCNNPISHKKMINVTYNDEEWYFDRKSCRNQFLESLPLSIQKKLKFKPYCCGDLDPVKTSYTYVCKNCGLELDIKLFDTSSEFQKRERVSLSRFNEREEFMIQSENFDDIEFD